MDEKKRRGRKGKYEEWLTEEGLLKIQGWARDGLTNEQIAQNMGVIPNTLYKWMNQFEDIREALKKGKEVADREVENALFKSAVGHYYEEDAVTNKGDVVRIRKYEKPNTTAQIFWLKNRKPLEWRDKQEIEQNSRLEVTGITIKDIIDKRNGQDDH
jgi:hypothetical protein